MVMAANEFDEAVDVRPGENIHWKELNNSTILSSQCQLVYPNTPSDRCGNAEIIHTTQSTGEKK
jgi:hypothetical protein